MKDVSIYDIQYLDVDQGLVSSYIRAMLEDKSGNLWFASSYGVSRYDGNDFSHFTVESGLTHSTVLYLFEDSQDNIWFGTQKGVSCFNGDYFIHYTSKQGFSDFPVRQILQDDQGNIWFGTDNGLICLNRELSGGSFLHYTTEQGLSHNQVQSLLKDKNNDIWIGTDHGLNRFDGSSFTHYTTDAGLSSNAVLSMEQDRYGDLWLGLDNGLNRFNGTHFTVYLTQKGKIEGRVVAILEDSQDYLWFCTDNGLIQYVFDRDQGNFTHFNVKHGFTNSSFRCILEDRQGNLWFGTGGGGVNRFNSSSFSHLTTARGLTSKGVVAIHEDMEGILWFGTESGLNRMEDSVITHITEQEGLIDDDVRQILEDKKGQLWFGTDGGACRFDGKSFTHFTTENGLIDNEIMSMLVDRRGHLWFGTRKGLCQYNPNTPEGNFTHYTMADGLICNEILTLLEDSRGNIWMGTANGLSRYDPYVEGGQFTHITTSEGLIDNLVWSLFEDSNGLIWIGTGGGLSRYNPDPQQQSFTHYTRQDGLSNNFIWSIVEDKEHNIWVSTEMGISLLKPIAPEDENGGESQGAAYQFFTFDKTDGLKRMDFQANSVCLDHLNRLWWGTEGATMLDLNRFKLATEPPEKLRLTQIAINQQFVDYRGVEYPDHNNVLAFREDLVPAYDSVVTFFNYPENPKLPHRLKHLTFHFSVCEWTRPQKVRYQYYIENLEETWNSTSYEPLADYRNIPSGKYTFKLRAKVDTQEWSDVVEYPFQIRPPWWKSTGAFTFYILLIGGVLFLSFRYAKGRWTLDEQRKRDQEEYQRLKELDSFKSKLYTNLTHEFRTPLTVILGMANRIKSNPTSHLQEGLTLIQRNGKQLLRLVNQLLDLSKLEDRSFQLNLQRADIIPFLHYITDSFVAFADGRNLALEFRTEVDEVVMDYDPVQIEQVMINLISNAIKFTPSGGRIDVVTDRQEDCLVIEISDTGIGIMAKELPRIFDRFYQIDDSSTRIGEGTGIGLAHTRELVKLMKGEIEVESAPGDGTTFVISLPLQIRETAWPDAHLVENGTGEAKGNGRTTASKYFIDYFPEVQTGRPPGPIIRKNKDVVLPKLLVIEDNSDTVTYLRTFLSDHYELTFATDGVTGIEKALEIIPDLIISDVMMPGKDGFEVCQTLKNDEKTSHIPIILLTAKGDMPSKITGLATGADAYLSKPFNEEELLVRLENMVRKQKKLLAYFTKKFENGFTRYIPSRNYERVRSKEELFIERVREIVEANYPDENFSLPELCQQINMSRSQLYRKMKSLIDCSPSTFIRLYRLEKAKILLETRNMNVTEVAWAVGFKDVAHFSKLFLDEFGYPPSEIHK